MFLRCKSPFFVSLMSPRPPRTALTRSHVLKSPSTRRGASYATGRENAGAKAIRHQFNHEESPRKQELIPINCLLTSVATNEFAPIVTNFLVLRWNAFLDPAFLLQRFGAKLGFEWAEASTITHFVSKTTTFCPVKPRARLLRHPSHLFWKEKHADSSPASIVQGKAPR